MTKSAHTLTLNVSAVRLLFFLSSVLVWLMLLDLVIYRSPYFCCLSFFSSFEISTNCLAISSEEMMPLARAQVFLSTIAILSFLTASKLCQTGSSSCFFQFGSAFPLSTMINMRPGLMSESTSEFSCKYGPVKYLDRLSVSVLLSALLNPNSFNNSPTYVFSGCASKPDLAITVANTG